MSLRKTLLVLACATVLPLGAAATQTPHNLILFVPDGLRALAVTPQSAPARIDQLTSSRTAVSGASGAATVTSTISMSGDPEFA